MEVAIRMDVNYIRKIDFPIELAFVDVEEFLHTKNKTYVQQIVHNNTKVCSIHVPHFNILDKDIRGIWYKLLSLSEDLSVNNIVFHPSFGNINNREIKKNLELISCICGSLVTPCIEHFISKRRWCSTLQEHWDLFLDYGFGCCYDFSHTRDDEKAIIDYLKITPVLHCSNTIGEKQHQRIIEGRIDFKKIIGILNAEGWDAHLVLEYMPYLHQYLEEDAKWLNNIIYNVGKTNIGRASKGGLT